MDVKKVLAIVLILGLLFVAALAIASPTVSAVARGVSGGGDTVKYCSSEFMGVEEFFKCMT